MPAHIHENTFHMDKTPNHGRKGGQNSKTNAGLFQA